MKANFFITTNLFRYYMIYYETLYFVYHAVGMFVILEALYM